MVTECSIKEWGEGFCLGYNAVVSGDFVVVSVVLSKHKNEQRKRRPIDNFVMLLP